MAVRCSPVVVDNTGIVSYCPILSRIFNAHINLEFYNYVKFIIYICKYVNKGSGMAIYEITSNYANDHDEVTQYQMGRYISSIEAVWRILDFNIHKRHPAVIYLGVHF